MKPSERIQELYVSVVELAWELALQHDPQVAHADPAAVQQWRAKMHAVHLARAMTQYLDEQYEKQRQRVIDPPVTVTVPVTPWLKQRLDEAGIALHRFGCDCADCTKGRFSASHTREECNCPESLALKQRVTSIAESMENSSGSPMITADVEHHLKHWATKLREAVG